MIDIFLRCVPPSTTAQQGTRARAFRLPNGRLTARVYQGAPQREAAATWVSLLEPYQPDAPLEGPVVLELGLVWPHPRGARKRDRDRLVPKTTKPDAGNVAKQLEDVLVKLRFLVDDRQVARLVVEKFLGPEALVGVRVHIRPFVPREEPSHAPE